MNNREFRLRRRIDQLTDQRDQARTQLDEWRRRGERFRKQIYRLTRTNEVLRLRLKQRIKR